VLDVQREETAQSSKQLAGIDGELAQVLMHSVDLEVATLNVCREIKDVSAMKAPKKEKLRRQHTGRSDELRVEALWDQRFGQALEEMLDQLRNGVRAVRVKVHLSGSC
jgi:hypothetical protein